MLQAIRQILTAAFIVIAGVMPTVAFDQTVYGIQQALTDLGYDPGPIDGAMGSKTQAAIAAMQSAQGLETSGDLAAVLEQVSRAVEAANAPVAPADLAVEINIQSPGDQGPAKTIGIITPDHRLYAEIAGNTAAVYDFETGRKLRTLYGHTKFVRAIALSADGTRLASASQDETVRIWDVETGRQLKVLRPDRIESYDAASDLAFTADGRYLAVTGGSGLLTVYDARSGAEVRRVRAPADGVNSLLSVSGDGALVAWSVAETIAIAEIDSGERLSRFSVPGDGWFSHLEFAPDGSKIVAIATVERDDDEYYRVAYLFDLNGEQLAKFELGKVDWDSRTPGMAVAQDSSEMILELGKGEMLRYDFDSGSQQSLTMAHDVAVLAYGNGDALYVGGPQPYAIDLNNIEYAPDLSGAVAEIEAMEFGRDGLLQILSGDGGIKWDLGTGGGEQVHPGTLEGSRSSMISEAGAPPGLDVKLQVVGTTAMIVPAMGGEPLQTVVHPDTTYMMGALSDDGRYIATIGENYDVRVWDAGTGEVAGTFTAGGHGEIRFAPGGDLIAVGFNERAEIWNWRTGERAISLPFSDDVMTTAFSADGSRIALGGLYGQAGVWDLRSGERLWTQNGQDYVGQLAFSADGSRLGAMSTQSTMIIRDAETGATLLHIDTLESNGNFALSEDNKKLAIDTPNGLKIFDAHSGELLLTTVFILNGEWVAITPEGFFNASVNGAQYVTVSRGFEVYGIDQVYDALYRPDLVQAKLAGDLSGLVAAAAETLDLKIVIGSGAAPNVMIASPAMDADVDGDTVEVVARFTDQGGGIGKIEWRVNGVTLGVETRGFDRLAVEAQAAAAEPVTVARMLSLDPGDNAIEVLAYNAEGLVASETATVNVTWTGASPSTPPRLYVLAAGINDYYDSRLQLTYAASDARAIASAFQTAGAGLYESVEVTTLLDGDVTAARLDEVFADLSTKVRPRDVFVLFMAGHGKTQDGRYYFLPQDFRYTDENSVAAAGIDQDKFQEWMALIPARKSLLLYDTCDSGSLTGAVASRGLEEVAALARMTRAMGRTVLSASTDDAPALEGYNGHGVFTYSLLQALGDGDANSDGTIDVTELAGSIDRSVPEISFAAFNLRQIPQMSIIGSDFPVVNRMAVLTGPAEFAIPSTPSHVVIASAEMHEAAGAQSAITGSVVAGMLVRVVETQEGWSLIAKDGKPMGYVETTSLAAIQ